MGKLMILLLLTIIIINVGVWTRAESDVVNELVSLQSSSPQGVIHLNDHLVSRFLTSATTPRPYYLLIFFDATQLHDKTELHLRDLKREFSLLAASFISNNNNNNSLFFFDIEFGESQSTFSLFGVKSLPHIRLVGPNVQNPKDSEQMGQGDFSRLAESMSDFIQSKTKLSVGPIHRPPPLSRNQLAFLVVVLVMWTPFLVKKLLTRKTPLHDPRVWMSGALLVYFFSVSGAMHNIIRRMPMFLADRNDPTKLIFFYQGSGMQLGAEGFAVGSLYTLVGFVLALVTHLVVWVRNRTAQRLIMLVAMFVSFWAVKKVVYLDNWKTGYGIHAFWPSSWR